MLPNIQPLNTVQTIIHESKEEVNENHIYEFIKYVLSKNGVQLNKKLRVFYSYLSHTKQYQISYFTPISSTSSIVFEYIKTLSDELVIHQDFFAVIINGCLYYYQILPQPRDDKEIQEYVKRRLKIDNLKVRQLEQFEHRKYTKVEYLKKLSYNYFLSYLSVYAVSALALFILWSQNTQNVIVKNMLINKQEQQLEQLQKKSQFKANSYLTAKHFLETIDSYKLSLLHYVHEKKSITLRVSSIDKNNLYAFLDVYKKHKIQSNIEFEQEGKYYVLYGTFTSH